MRHFALKQFALLAALTLGMPLAATSSAWAHAALVAEQPTAGATVAAPAPSALKLSFSEQLELSFSKVVVKGPDGAVVATGPAALDPADPKTLVVPMTATLPTGTVTIEWTAVATDGHKTKGSYTLNIAN